MEIDIEHVYKEAFYCIKAVTGQEGQAWRNKKETLFDILEEVYDDVLGQYDTSHLGTFAEFKKEGNDGNKKSN